MRRRIHVRSGDESRDQSDLVVRSLADTGGEGGIRTHEGLQTLAGFQDQCIQPLCHLSVEGPVTRRRILDAGPGHFNTPAI